jgi:hypothetical protein
VVSFGGTGTQAVRAAASIPGTTDFIAAGAFDGTFGVPGGPSVNAQATDIFVVRVDATGKVVWSKTFGGAGIDLVAAVAADADGNVFLTGTFDGPTLDFGGAPLANADKNGTSTHDVFVAWLDGTGKHLYSARFGDEREDNVAGIALDGTGRVVLAGSFEGAIDFGTGPLRARGKSDLFVAKFAR